MQWDKLKQNIGYRVRLSPIACRLDGFGLPLPEMDEDWLISQGVENETIQISRTGGHSIPLGKDQVHHFTSDPIRSIGEAKYGMLSLLVQIYIQGADVKVRPTLRPGEPLPPPQVRIEDKVVDFRYPTDSGIQAKLIAQGYKVSWCLESRLSRLIELEGWEIVVERMPNGELARYRAKDPRDDQVLVKKLVA